MTAGRAPGVVGSLVLIAGQGSWAMPPAISSLARRLALADLLASRKAAGFALIALPNLAALVMMATTEVDLAGGAVFLVFWGFLLFGLLALLRRPATASAIALALVGLLVLFSQFKHGKLWMTLNFVDLMVIDRDTSAFLLTVFPALRWKIAVAVPVALALLVACWRLDPFRMRRSLAALGGAACLAGMAALTFVRPATFYEQFMGENYVSKFARSGVEAVWELATRGVLEADAAVAERLKAPVGDCAPKGKLPHIVMLHDESNFDIRAAPGVKVPAGYGRHFRSFDGKARRFVVEGPGGPSWYTEYNVLTGLSARSFGRFADSVTRIAAGRVERGLPHALRRCGYRTFSLYPFLGAFLGARAFQTGVGIEHFLDMKDLGAKQLEPDRFYFDRAAQLIARERGRDPLFLFVYTAANHFPWTFRFRPELTPGWRDPGNAPYIDEYIRRQTMTARDYAGFIARLKAEFPKDPFLIVRFGDHQPEFAYRILDPTLDKAQIARRLEADDARYYTSYYAIDTINFRPVDLSSALATIDAAYLPIVIQDLAGVPLDPSFAEQKRILARCAGRFYACSDGAEARRLNRLLIDAGLIKGL
jgi:hypothetical protein